MHVGLRKLLTNNDGILQFNDTSDHGLVALE
jgi:hypothetical protein